MSDDVGGLSKEDVLERMAEGESFHKIFESAGVRRGLFFSWRAEDKQFDRAVKEIVGNRKARRAQRQKRRLETPIQTAKRVKKKSQAKAKVKYTQKMYRRAVNKLKALYA